MTFFHRLRTNPAGYIAMFLGSLAPIPIDMTIAQMTLGQSLTTRASLIVLRTLLGGQYDHVREELIKHYSFVCPKWIIDATLYSLFQTSGYAVMLLLMGVDGKNTAFAMAFVAATSYLGGPFFGIILDQLKEWIESFREWRKHLARSVD
jgi:hypothetical protein